MKDYALYYSYKGIGDVLLVVIDNSLSMTSYKRINNVVVIYHDEDIIGFNIFDIKDIIKIKNEGMIYYPTEQFLNVINSLLENAKLPILDKKENSGYFIGEVVDLIPLNEEKTFVSVDLENDFVSTIVKDHSLSVGDKVVVAKVGTYLSSGEVVKEGNMDGTLLNGHICTNKELGINEELEKILVLDKDETKGNDFFSMEENK